MTRPAGLALLLLLALPASARADHVFLSGEYAGATGQDRTVRFAADHSGVHVFSTRLRVRCGGERRTLRVSVPHVERLDDDTGRFTFTPPLRVARRPAADRHARGDVRARHRVAASGRLRERARATGRRSAAAAAGITTRRTGGGAHPHGDSALTRLGNRAPYPVPARASAANGRRAEALRAGELGEARRFATVALAEAAGYVADPAISPVHRPGLCTTARAARASGAGCSTRARRRRSSSGARAPASARSPRSCTARSRARCRRRTGTSSAGTGTTPRTAG